MAFLHHQKTAYIPGL